MPGSAAKVLSLINDPEVSASEIEELVKLDPGLTANILKVTNSAYFGLPTEVGSLKRAIVLLGLKRVVQIVIASCVTALMDKAVRVMIYFPVNSGDIQLRYPLRLKLVHVYSRPGLFRVVNCLRRHMV